MKRLLLIAAALLALTNGADAFEERRYTWGGAVVRMLEFEDGEVEIRLMPGWQVDPKCPKSELADACDAAMGIVLFSGNWSECSLNGEASLYRRGDVEEGFAANIRRTKNGGLVLSPNDGSAKCKAVFRPVR
jgi:hypothetical protein